MVVSNGRSFGGVGINLTSPKAELHVHCTATHCYFMITNPWSGTNINDGFNVCARVNDCSLTWKGNDQKKAEIQYVSGDLHFKTQLQSSSETDMCIIDGDVGIGTTSPGAKFEIDGSVGSRDNPNNASEKALFIGDGNNGLYLNMGTSSNGTSAAFGLNWYNSASHTDVDNVLVLKNVDGVNLSLIHI